MEFPINNDLTCKKPSMEVKVIIWQQNNKVDQTCEQPLCSASISNTIRRMLLKSHSGVSWDRFGDTPLTTSFQHSSLLWLSVLQHRSVGQFHPADRSAGVTSQIGCTMHFHLWCNRLEDWSELDCVSIVYWWAHSNDILFSLVEHCGSWYLHHVFKCVTRDYADNLWIISSYMAAGLRK